MADLETLAGTHRSDSSSPVAAERREIASLLRDPKRAFTTYLISITGVATKLNGALCRSSRGDGAIPAPRRRPERRACAPPA